MTDRLLNYLYIFFIIVVFVLYTDGEGRIWIVSAMILGFIAVLIFYLNNALTIDGAGAAWVVGVLSLGLGKWTGAVLILFFFCSSYVISFRIDQLESGKRDQPIKHKVTERRSGDQVWANSFWFVLMISAFFLFGENWMIICAAAAVSAATSDTWSSIIGSRFSDRVWLVTTFREVPPGTHGGISYSGTLAALTGAFSIAFLFLLTRNFVDFSAVWIILAAGFSGCFVDSYLGAIFQNHKSVENRTSGITDKLKVSLINYLKPDNDGVNFLSTGSAALIAFILY